jgi:hypothetical protein
MVRVGAAACYAAKYATCTPPCTPLARRLTHRALWCPARRRLTP